jgi:hypothetical protein
MTDREKRPVEAFCGQMAACPHETLQRGVSPLSGSLCGPFAPEWCERD